MAQSEKAKEILRRLQEGTSEIYARYESLIRSSDAAYQSKMAEVDREYAAAANRASAQAKIDLKNSLEKMADAGYVGSGETVQATIAANANKAEALSLLATQRAKDKKEYEMEKEKARATLSLQGEKEAMDYEASMAKALQEQENLDREYEENKARAEREYQQRERELEAQRIAQEAQREQERLEYEAREKERAFNQMLQAEKLKLEKAAAAKKEAEAKAKKAAGITPEKSPYDYVDDIIEKNTTYHKKKGYKVIDRKEILLAISAIVKDTRISYQYRYEMYLYGKSLGYVD